MCPRRAKVIVSPDPEIPDDSTISGEIEMGLYLAGKVVDRTRRYVPKDNPTTEIVTYTIEDDSDHRYYVDDYAPQGIYYEVGAYGKWPVYVKPYTKKNKEASYTLGIQKKEIRSKGERF